eukprot:4505020-Karenia_brevis.AAC.1
MLPRAEIWKTVEQKAVSVGLAMLLEELHDGTCYLLLDMCSGEVVRKLWVRKGVRQGSCEGPLLFVALYDVVMRELESRRGNTKIFASYDKGLEHFIGQHARATCVHEEMVADVVFMDDLISLLVFSEVSEVEAFIALVVQVFELWKFKVNFAKLEVLVAAYGEGSAE